jgi:VIT1/CCC1 family predicted Fe2+/Mn2+ transporter
MPEPPRNRLNKEDWLGAIGIFLLVFLSTFPVILPFFFVKDAWLALRISNGIAIVLLFLCGYSLGSYAGDKSWKPGLMMVIVGVLLVAITMALGG